MKKRQIISISIIMTFALIMTACGKTEKFPPAAINPEVDVCDVCNMAVADDEHATQLILDNGRSLKFDDLGDLFVWRERNGLDEVNVQYVRDYHTLEWIELDSAYYAYDASFHTPMGFGVVSFASKSDAEAFVAEHGAGIVMTAAELKDHHWESAMSHGEHGHGHGHGDHDNGHEDGDEHGDEHGDKHGDEHDDHGHEADHDH